MHQLHMIFQTINETLIIFRFKRLSLFNFEFAIMVVGGDGLGYTAVYTI